MQVHHARRFYENLVPSYTVYEVECPDHSFRKFTDDGQYLISFSRNHQELIVYRPRWLSFSCKNEDCDKHDLPSRAKRFDSFFTQLYCVALASCNELICKDFFLYWFLGDIFGAHRSNQSVLLLCIWKQYCQCFSGWNYHVSFWELMWSITLVAK